jgi:hypothetical protein
MIGFRISLDTRSALAFGNIRTCVLVLLPTSTRRVHEPACQPMIKYVSECSNLVVSVVERWISGILYSCCRSECLPPISLPIMEPLENMTRKQVCCQADSIPTRGYISKVQARRARIINASCLKSASPLIIEQIQLYRLLIIQYSTSYWPKDRKFESSS